MIIPWKVDVPQEYRPFVNWLIIAVIIGVFVLQVITFVEQESEPVEKPMREWGAKQEQAEEEEEITGPIVEFVLRGWGIKGLLGYMWLHGGIIHLLGNLLFLWIFGNSVCGKIGNAAYLPIYLLLGVFAGLSHLVFQGGAAIGASGAINGIVGMYLVFFAQNEITCYFVWILFITPIVREFSLSSYWMILLWLMFDILGAMMGGGGVAYFAHLGGFAAGFGLAILMLKTNMVKMERYERSLLQIWQERKEPVGGELEQVDRRFASVPEYGSLGNELKDKTKGAAAIAYQEPVRLAEPKSIPLEPEEVKEEFIRFACSCGKRFKVPMSYAGRMSRCPNCKSRMKIPEK